MAETGGLATRRAAAPRHCDTREDLSLCDTIVTNLSAAPAEVPAADAALTPATRSATSPALRVPWVPGGCPAPPEPPARRGPRALPALWVPPVPEVPPALPALRVQREPLALPAQPARRAPLVPPVRLVPLAPRALPVPRVPLALPVQPAQRVPPAPPALRVLRAPSLRPPRWRTPPVRPTWLLNSICCWQTCGPPVCWQSDPPRRGRGGAPAASPHHTLNYGGGLL